MGLVAGVAAGACAGLVLAGAPDSLVALRFSSRFARVSALRFLKSARFSSLAPIFLRASARTASFLTFAGAFASTTFFVTPSSFLTGGFARSLPATWSAFFFKKALLLF
jgi:hypothetical protein